MTIATTPSEFESGRSRLSRLLAPLRRGRKVRAPGPPPAIGGYRHTHFFRRHRRLCYLALILFAAFYGFVFGLFGRYLFVYLMMPLVPVTLAVIWLLPDTERAPLKLAGQLLIGYFIALSIWPDYLALALPGMPWITAIRLFGVLLAGAFLISMSTSPSARRQLRTAAQAAPWITRLYLLFMVTAFLTIALSPNLFDSLNKFIIAQLNWTLILFASIWYFAKPGRVPMFAAILWGCAMFQLPIVVYEQFYNKLPWVGHIPSFLQIADPTVTAAMEGSYRAFTNQYRVQGKFGTALNLGEYLALATPFVLHFLVISKRTAIKLLAAVSLMAILYMDLQTHARLAFIGFLLSVLLYGLVYSFLNWRARRGGILGPALVLSYPAVFVGVLALSFVWRRLEVLVWGGGAEQSSTEARKSMYARGFELVLQNPVGHGMGQGGLTLGFFNNQGIPQIDTYIIAVALEYGVIGFLAYFGMLIYAIWMSGQTLLRTDQGEISWLGPVAIALVNFFVIKTVLSQQDNHPVVFMILGIVCGLVAQAKLMPSVQTAPFSRLSLPVWGGREARA